MPCDSVLTSVVEWAATTDHNSLEAALKVLKLNPNRSGDLIYFSGGNYNTKTNKLTLAGSNAEQRTKDIKRMYMAEATKAQAKRFGFTVKQGKSAFEFELVKRSI